MKSPQTVSLQDIMNDMARQPSVVASAASAQKRRAASRSEEENAFIIIDPLLAELHRQHSEADNNRKRLERRHGVNDPMTRVAADIADSTKSAFETRLIELRRDEEICAKAAFIAKKRAAEEEREQAERKSMDALRRQFLSMEQARDLQKKNKQEQSDYNAALWMMIWALKKIVENNGAGVMALARDFTAATDPRSKVAA